MRKTLSLDAVVRREIKHPDLLANAVLVLDFVDALTEAFRWGKITTYRLTFDEWIRRRYPTPEIPEFWIHHQLDVPEYMVTGRGLITDRYWFGVPSYADVLIDAAQVKRWLFRRRIARFFKWITKPNSLYTIPPKTPNVEVKAAISRAVEDHIKGVAMKPEDVFVPAEPIQKSGR